MREHRGPGAGSPVERMASTIVALRESLGELQRDVLALSEQARMLRTIAGDAADAVPEIDTSVAPISPRNPDRGA